jgi:hypothetical protein
MERYIWFRKGPQAAKVAWIKESKSGLYFAPRPKLTSAHYTYHTEGQRHLKTSKGNYIGTKLASPLEAISGHGNVGGFSIEPQDLVWTGKSKFREADLPINYDDNIRGDLPIIASLDFCSAAELDTYLKIEWSSGPGFSYRCVSFDLEIFPHLKGIVRFQYQVSV